METRKRVLGDEHPSTLISMNNLAYTLHALDRNRKALVIMRRCVDLSSRLLGKEHPHTKVSVDTSKALEDTELN